MTATGLQAKMVQAHYQPGNNIFARDGWIMHPTAPDQPWVTVGHDVQVTPTTITLWTWHGDQVQTFTSVGEFQAWCRRYGQLSEPGLPAFSNGWD